jgi:hypothetical protein
MGGGTSIRCVFLLHMLLTDLWKGSVYVMTAISGLPEPLYRYGVEDIQKLLSVLMRGREPKILYIKYDYYDEGEHFVKILDPEFKTFLEKKGITSPTDEVDMVNWGDVEEFLNQRGATSLYIVEIEDDDEDAAAIVAYR